jgi:hypothetical protein
MKLTNADLISTEFNSAFSALCDIKTLGMLTVWDLVEVQKAIQDQFKKYQEAHKRLNAKHFGEDVKKHEGKLISDILTKEQMKDYDLDMRTLNAKTFEIPLAQLVAISGEGLSAKQIIALNDKIITKA